MKRNNSRIKVMMMLYNDDILNGQECEKLDEMIEEELGDVDEEFVKDLYDGVREKQNEIDAIISSNLINYAFNRLNYVDRALLRIGVYEVIYLKTPKNIVINEIIEISKKYSQTDDYLSSKFNNSLLDKIFKKEINE